MKKYIILLLSFMFFGCKSNKTVSKKVDFYSEENIDKKTSMYKYRLLTSNDCLLEYKGIASIRLQELHNFGISNIYYTLNFFYENTIIEKKIINTTSSEQDTAYTSLAISTQAVENPDSVIIRLLNKLDKCKSITSNNESANFYKLELFYDKKYYYFDFTKDSPRYSIYLEVLNLIPQKVKEFD